MVYATSKESANVARQAAIRCIYCYYFLMLILAVFCQGPDLAVDPRIASGYGIDPLKIGNLQVFISIRVATQSSWAYGLRWR